MKKIKDKHLSLFIFPILDGKLKKMYLKNTEQPALFFLSDNEPFWTTVFIQKLHRLKLKFILEIGSIWNSFKLFDNKSIQCHVIHWSKIPTDHQVTSNVAGIKEG